MYRLNSSKHQDNLNKVFSQLFASESLSDVTIQCDDGAIQAHRIILASSSEYFMVGHPVILNFNAVI